MAALRSWRINGSQQSFWIEYLGTTPGGAARVTINYVENQYPLTQSDSEFFFTILPLADRECILRIDQSGQDIQLLVDGVATPPEIEADASADDEPATATQPVWERQVKSGMSSFLTLIILSLLNIVLTAVESTIFFPFSISATIIALSFGQAFSAEAGSSVFYIAGLILAVLIMGIFIGLYVLTRRYAWPAWVAFGLVVGDTLLLIGLALINQDLMSMLIDIAFHIWMIFSLFRLALAKTKIARQLV